MLFGNFRVKIILFLYGAHAGGVLEAGGCYWFCHEVAVQLGSGTAWRRPDGLRRPASSPSLAGARIGEEKVDQDFLVRSYGGRIVRARQAIAYYPPVVVFTISVYVEQ